MDFACEGRICTDARKRAGVKAVKTNRIKQTLYESIAERMLHTIENGTFEPGDRIPSIRSLSRQMKVSINTVKEAYNLLEDRRIIDVRPQSGFFVASKGPEEPSDPEIEDLEISPSSVNTFELIRMVVSDCTTETDLVSLCALHPSSEILPIKKLNQVLTRSIKESPEKSIAYTDFRGYPALRQEIARRLIHSGCAVSPDEVIVTTGCVEAVFLSLMAICNRGDTVAVESPLFFTYLQLFKQLDLNVIEIPMLPQRGMSIEALEYALKHNEIRVCVSNPTFNNPIGSLMPVENKARLIELLNQHDVPLIEDDVFGDLSFEYQRPLTVKHFDTQERVILCSSFSKTIAPGFRVGWVVAGRYKDKIERLKMLTSITSPSPTQLALADFLASGGYDRCLRRMCRFYNSNLTRMRRAIGDSFPDGTKVTDPRGGYSLWLELPETVDSITLFEESLKKKIHIAPGPIFSAVGRYKNCIRLNGGRWSAEIKDAVETIGFLAKKLAYS